MKLKSLVPWYLRIAAKLVLSRLPAGYAFWHRLHLFSHGAMDSPDYAYKLFRAHFDRTPFARKGVGWVGLELGPGDSALSALSARAHGAARCILVDAGPFATRDPVPYRRLAAYLTDSGLRVPAIGSDTDFDDILRVSDAEYLTEGLVSLRSLPSSSVDFVWSQAVLEHVRREQFLETMQELRRVLRPDGACSHRIDLKDHLGGGLNNLRLPSSWWEREWMASSGFYTNRLRQAEMDAIFRKAGFQVDTLSVNRWERAPIERHQLAAEFTSLDEAQLNIREFDVLLRPSRSAQ